jgi:broad specificity phosphatase PhoE
VSDIPLADDAVGTKIAPLAGFEAIRRLAAGFRLPQALESFIFVRHGETEGNRRGIYQVSETPLNEAGEAQARAAAAALSRHRPLGRIAASPMARAWRTASIVAGPDGRPEPDGALQERLYLGLAGQPVGHLDWSVDPPGCERLSAFVDRAARALVRLAEEEASAPGPGPLVVVSHGGVLLVLAALCDVEPAADLRRNATPMMVRRSGDRWTFEALG